MLMFLALEFSALSVALGFVAVATGGAARLVFVWASVSFALVALAYFGKPELVFAKHRESGRIRLRAKALLWPYLLLTWGMWHVARLFDRKAPFAELAPGLYIGR